MFITTWQRLSGSITNIEPANSAQDAKCLIDDFYEIQNQEYNLISNTAVSFKFFSSDGLQVGTQMYNSSTNAPISSAGVYLFANGTGELNIQNGEAGIDPTNTATVPSTFFMMVLNSSGIITNYVQYSQLAACENTCTYYPEQGGYFFSEGYVNNVSNATINLSEAANYTSAFCDAYVAMVNWEADSRPICDGSNNGNCKTRDQIRTEVFWEDNICDPQASPFSPRVGAKLYEKINQDYFPIINRRFVTQIGQAIGGIPYSTAFWQTLGAGIVPSFYLMETNEIGVLVTKELFPDTNWDYTACQ